MQPVILTLGTQQGYANLSSSSPIALERLYRRVSPRRMIGACCDRPPPQRAALWRLYGLTLIGLMLINVLLVKDFP
jgi:hypothetical protein